MHMINHEPDKNLERLIHERLRALPEMQAPKTLASDVLKKIQARRVLAWWNQASPEWPPALRILSGVLLLIGAASLFAFHDQILGELAALANRISSGSQVLKPLWTILEMLLEIVQVLAGAIKSQMLIIAAAMIGLLYLSTIGLGTMMNRVVAGKN